MSEIRRDFYVIAHFDNGTNFLADQESGGEELATEVMLRQSGQRTGASALVSLGKCRKCDAWGNVPSGPPTGTPDQRYCASLGHRQDDESGLIYMRARFYEPTTGRFVSEDPAMDGTNWFVYCENEPVVHVDLLGTYRWQDNEIGLFGRLCTVVAMESAMMAMGFAMMKEYAIASTCIKFAAHAAAAALLGVEDFGSDMDRARVGVFRFIFGSPTFDIIALCIARGAGQGASSPLAFVATASATSYAIAVLGALALTMEGS